jgi:hypothetical protein
MRTDRIQTILDHCQPEMDHFAKVTADYLITRMNHCNPLLNEAQSDAAYKIASAKYDEFDAARQRLTKKITPVAIPESSASSEAAKVSEKTYRLGPLTLGDEDCADLVRMQVSLVLKEKTHLYLTENLQKSSDGMRASLGKVKATLNEVPGTDVFIHECTNHLTRAVEDLLKFDPDRKKIAQTKIDYVGKQYAGFLAQAGLATVVKGSFLKPGTRCEVPQDVSLAVWDEVKRGVAERYREQPFDFDTPMLTLQKTVGVNINSQAKAGGVAVR